jgi:hypothetical protein
VAADVGRIGAIVTRGNAAAAGPMRGVASSAAGDVGAGIAVLFLSGGCRVRKRKINVAELAVMRFGWAYSS